MGSIIMGMYTELIFGATLKAETPSAVIEALQYMIGDIEDKPDNFPLPDGRCEWLLRGRSYYFGVSEPVSKIVKNKWSWVVSTRSNIKNYKGEIECFLEWIKPYIEVGSGARDMYAIVIYQEEETPTIYYLHESDYKAREGD